ncbi:hypothetical protein GCM10025771_22460 [Niveibacterium umoris]|uniref:Uncharacterized protein n=1 Tax=Niveibacterium umoris TaxID=1193620 RepID=A0A840BH79_9RHOO|nr:hypothetical protein [Niveibacterium umoris]MBB4012565.1 hypothetical protein [Niveibacterium umoris]
MKTLRPRFTAHLFAAMLATAGVSFSIGGTLFLLSMPASEYTAAKHFAAHGLPLLVAHQE